MVNGWIEKPLADVADVKTGPFGSALHANDYVNAGTPIITVEHLGDSSITCQNLPLVSDIDKCRLSAYTLNEGDIVFSRVGSVDRNAYVTAKEEGWLFSGRLLRIRITASNDVDPKYLSYYFKYETTKARIYSVAVGQTMASLNTKIMNDFFIEYPELPEQCHIAEALTNTDALIAAMEKLIAKKRAIKQGAMQELLTGKRRLRGFSGEWISCGLPKVLSSRDGIKIGPFGSQLKKEYLAQNGIYRVYGQENVYQNDFTLGDRYLSRERFEKLQSCEIISGDFVISTMGTIGKCAIVPHNICAGIMDSHLIRLRINKAKLLPSYLLHLFSSDFGFLSSQTSRLSVGGIMDGLSTKIICSLEIEYPEHVEEQTAIATILSDMDAEIDALTAKLNKLRNIKQGMMSELLTGRIRLVEQKTAVAKTVELPVAKPTTKSASLRHSEGYEDAVILVALVNAFGTEQYPFTAFDCQKFPYLFHRHIEGVTKGYKKFAAGPYNPSLKYQTARPIALKKNYVREYIGNYKGLVISTNAQEALEYFLQWYGDEPLKWLEQFRFIPKRKDELELLTTTDKAMVELRSEGKPVALQSVKELIKKSPAWKDKLKRPIFSDGNITRAINWSNKLFGQEVPANV